MHKTTKDSLETLARWTTAVVASDYFARQLEEHMPDGDLEGGGIYHSMDSSFGSLMLTLYRGDAIGDAGPYLRAARLAGFERWGSVEENAERNTVAWRYTSADDVSLAITMNFRHGENASCQFVKVGEKTVDDMKMLCGAELEAWREANPS